MARVYRIALGAIVVTASVLVATRPADAGPILTWLGFGDDPPPVYSPARFWAPGAAKVHDDLFAPRVGVYPPNRHPEIPPTHDIKRYPTSIALPKETINQRPAAPATSPAR
jgi:hypothetical protein